MRNVFARADRYPHVPFIPAEKEPDSFAPGGLVASARRLTSNDITSRNKAASGGLTASPDGWQHEAWKLVDIIGEQRFLVHTLASGMARANLFVGRMQPGDDTPEETEDRAVLDVLDALGGGPAGLSQLLKRLGLNLLIAGECWLVGMPPSLLEAGVSSDAKVLDLVWRAMSISEISISIDATATVHLETGQKATAPVDDLFLVRVWQPHPLKACEADSPTRASLPVLRELLGLTMHVSAQIDSRLGGAGLLLMPSSASAAFKRAAGMDEGSPEDPLMEALMEAMVTPISDRASASAVVPLALTVPDDVVEKVRHLSFSTPLDKEARQLRDEAIRRLALGQDAPPELLLGTGGMNHWGAWAVREDVVRAHLEPMLALICDALTTQYLRPVLVESGMFTPEEAGAFVVWFDTDHMITRPNKQADAKDLFAAGAISAESLREACGFEESDAPEAVGADPAVTTALAMLERAPALAQSPGLPALVEQIRAVLNGDTAPAGGGSSGDVIPATDTNDSRFVHDE